MKAKNIVGGLVFLISFGIYLKTMAPTVSFWDCGEFIATAYTLGVPHPPGAPLYILVGRVFTILLPFWEVARRVNFISVLVSSLAIMSLYFVIVRLVERIKGLNTPKWCAYLAGAVGALSLAFTHTFWFNAVEAEVYASSIFLTVLAIWLALVWAERHERPRADRLLLFLAYLLGLSGGVHLLCWLTVPTVFLLIWFTDRRPLKDFKLLGTGLLLFLLGYSTYLAILIRAGLDPAINENDPSTLHNFIQFLQRKQYGSESMILGMFHRRASFSYQFGDMFLKYILEQFPFPIPKWTAVFHAADGQSPYPVLVPLIPLLLAVFGMYYHFQRASRDFLAFFVFFLVTGVMLTVYLNMPQPQPRERHYVFVGAVAGLALYMGMGVMGLLDIFARGGRKGILSALGACFLMLPANFLVSHYHSHDRTGNYIPYDYAYNLLISCEPGGILFTNGDNDTFPLWFLQEVEGIRRDVRVVNLSLLNTPWYIKQLRDYEPKVPINLSDSYIDNRLKPRAWPEDRRIELAGLSWELKGGAVYRPLYGEPIRFFRIQDLMVLRIIQQNRWERPIYFAVTVSEENKIGLQDYLVMEGMVYRLTRSKGKDRVDIARMQENLFEKYRYRGVNDPRVYKDEDTVRLLGNYRAAFLQLAYAYYQKGRHREALETLKKADQVALMDWWGYYTAAQIALRAGSEEDSRKYLEKAIELMGEGSPDMWTSVAYLAEDLRDTLRASEFYRRAIQMDPFYPQAYYGLASMLEREGAPERALRVLEELARHRPGDTVLQEYISHMRGKLQEGR